MIVEEGRNDLMRIPDSRVVVTPVGKLRTIPATDTPSRGTHNNFPGAALDNLLCATTGTGDNIITSTPVRAEAGQTQEPLQEVTVGDPDSMIRKVVVSYIRDKLRSGSSLVGGQQPRVLMVRKQGNIPGNYFGSAILTLSRGLS